jgi:hypothetical protein
MKKLLAIFFFPFFAFGAIPESAEGWYTPEGGFKTSPEAAVLDLGKQGTIGCIVSYPSDGEELSVVWGQMDSYGNILPGKTPSEPGKTAIEKALKAYFTAKVNSDAIKTLGDNLNAVFSTEGITVTGKSPDGTMQSYTIKFKNKIGDDDTIQGESNHMSWNLADEKSLHLKSGNKIELFGWSSADAVEGLGGKYLSGIDFPVRYGYDSILQYARWYGFDQLSLAPHPTSKIVQLKDWNTAPSGLMLPLADALTNETKTSYCDYKVLVRNSSQGLNYVDIGTLAPAATLDGEKCETTLASMLLNEEDKNRDTHYLVSKLGTDKDSPIHYIALGDILPTNVASQLKVDGKSLAKKDDTLSILDFGDAKDGEMPVKRGDKVVWEQGSTKVDKISVTTNALGEISLPGVGDARDGQVLTKNGDTVAWKNATAEGDLVSITTNAQNKLSVYGFDAAKNGQVLTKKGGKVAWEDGGGIKLEEGAGISITTNETSHIISHNLVAGTGISILPAAGNAVTIASSTPVNGTVIDPHAEEISFITDLWYDKSTHQIMIKRTTAKIMVIGTSTTEDLVVIKCLPHSAEHSNDNE